MLFTAVNFFALNCCEKHFLSCEKHLLSCEKQLATAIYSEFSYSKNSSIIYAAYMISIISAYYHTSQASKCHYINTADSLQELRLEKLKLPNVFVYLRSKYESINKSDLIKKE